MNTIKTYIAAPVPGIDIDIVESIMVGFGTPEGADALVTEWQGRATIVSLCNKVGFDKTSPCCYREGCALVTDRVMTCRSEDIDRILQLIVEESTYRE